MRKILTLMLIALFTIGLNAQVERAFKGYKGTKSAPAMNATIEKGYATSAKDGVYNPSDSPAADAYSSNTYTELGWTDITVTETDVIGGITIDYDWTTDSWPTEGSFHLESPAGTEVIFASGQSTGTYSISVSDLNGETMDGNWKLWIQDSYGDGGHQATNITVTFHTALDDDLAVTNVTPSGFIISGSTITPEVTITNMGANDQTTFDVTLVSDPAGYDETISDPATIVSGDDLIVQFPDWSPGDGTYTLTGTVILTGDENPGNDVATSSINVGNPAFGDIIITFEAESPSQAGIETDGNFIYCPLWNGDDIYKYGMDGSFVESFTITGVSAVRDMAYNPNTGYFYGAAASTTLWEMDLDAQTLENTITAAAECRAILYDDDNNTFWGNNWDTPFTEFNPDGSATGNSITVSSQYGAAYDNWTDPSNPTIWAFTSDAGTPPNSLVEYEMDGTLTGRTIDVSTVPGFDAGIGGGLATYEEDGHAYLLANIQQSPNLIVKFYLAPAGPPPPTYTVTFNVTDDETTDPIEDATIDIDGSQLTTDASGVATIDLSDGDYPYTVNATDYDEYTGDVTVAGAATSVDVEMTSSSADYYEVTFGVYDGDGDVTAAVSGTPISSGDTVAEGDTVWFYADPDDGFKTNDWYLNGASTTINDDTVYYADLDMDIDLQVEFKPEGINDLESSELKVYPNPSTGLFNIDVDGSYEITIVSITGQVIYTNTITNNTTLNLSDQQAGIYFLRLKSDDKVVNKRILIE